MDPTTQISVGNWGTEAEMPEPESAELMQGYSGTSNPADWLVDSLSGGLSGSGVRVTGTTVLTSGPVYQV